MALAYRSNTQTINTSAGTTCSVAAPAGIVDNDILIFMMDRAVVTAAVTLTGFAQLSLTTHDGGSFYVAWKRASSESGSYDATWTGDSRSVGIVYVVSGALISGTPVTAGTTVVSTGTTPDPPSADPGSSGARFAIACYGQEGKDGSATPPGFYTKPTNSDGYTGQGSAAANCGCVAAYRTYTGQAEDPAVFTSALNDGWAAQTIVFTEQPGGGLGIPIAAYHHYQHNMSSKMQYLKADTNQEVLIGPAVAVGDGFVPITNLHGGSSNLAGTDEAELIKYGGATPLTVTDISTNAMTPITGADGYYTLDLSTGNLDTEGFLTIVINDDSLILPIRHEFMVVNANVYDSMFAVAGADKLQVDIVEQVGGTVPAPTTTGVPDVNVERWLDTLVTLSTGSKPDVNVNEWADVLLATTNPLPNAAADAAFGLPISDAGGLDLDTKLANTNEITVARMGALTDWIDAGRLDAILDIIAADVVNIDGSAMVGTDNAALASVVGTLADAAAADEVTSADTLIQYAKQIVNILAGAPGVTTLKAAAAPASGVSLSEMIRGIYDNRTIAAASYFDPTSDAVANVTLVDTLTAYTNNIIQTGDSYARIGAPSGASVSADIAVITADLPVKMTKNVALSNFSFLMVDSTSHVTGKTGLTFAASNSQRSIDGGAFANSTNVPTEVANGIYKVNLSAADMNGNVIVLKLTGTAADDRFITIITQAT